MDLSIYRSRPTVGGSALDLARKVLGWPGRVLVARRTMLQLAGLTDHELKDIGLMRQDLVDVSALKLDQDPSRLLARRAGDRRWGSRVRYRG